MPALTTNAAIASLPKVELHLHIEGTLEPELIFELAARNGITLPYDIGQLRQRYQFTDLQSFLDLYYENSAVLQTEQDFADLTRAYLRRARAAGVRHAEIFMDPQGHTSRGVDLATCVNGVAGALARSREEFGISTALIIAFLRDRPASEAMRTLEQLLAMDAPFIAVGLDSAEVGHPPADFAEVFALARANGKFCVAHAGEEGPPEYVWQSLKLLEVTRIDHGIRSMEDPALVDYLIEREVPLTVCPLSNVRLRAVDTLADHPLPDMLRRGMKVTVNSDDPAYFGGYVDDNFRELERVFGLGADELATLARNGVEASFLPDQERASLMAEIDRWRDARR